MNVAGSSLDSLECAWVRIGRAHVSRSLGALARHHPPAQPSPCFSTLRYDQDISYDGIRREGIQDPSHALISRKMTVVLDAIPRSGL